MIGRYCLEYHIDDLGYTVLLLLLSWKAEVFQL